MNRSLRLIFLQSYAYLRMEVEKAYLGFLWWLLEPILYMSAFYVIFTKILHRGGEDFVPFFLCGIIPWRWFGTSVQQGAASLLVSAALMRQVYLPKYIFPSTAVLTNTVKFFLVLLIFLIFLVTYGIEINIYWTCIPLLLLVQFVLIISITWAIAAIVPFLPDVLTLVHYSMLLLFFLSGIFFDINAAPENIATYFSLNPMALVIDNYRNVILRSRWPDWYQLFFVSLIAVIVWKLAHSFLRKFDHTYPKISF